MARETRKVAVPTAPIELKTVAKKAATAAMVAAGLATIDTALDALKLIDGQSGSDRSEQVGVELTLRQDVVSALPARRYQTVCEVQRTGR